MEILSATDWAFPTSADAFTPNVFFDVSANLDKKIEALSCYRNVMRAAPHPRSSEVLRGHAAYRGGQCGALAAEAFQLAYGFGF
jgi:LmbE family N-acetylglucosaminyl deacetylase